MKNKNTFYHYKKQRPNWDNYFIELTKLISTRATCLRRSVGCVLVFNNRILSTGYNGVPSNIAHCSIKGCIREKMKINSGERHELCNGLHAEQNVLIQCCLHGVSTKDSILYSTTFPCSICSKMLINAKIKKIIYLEDYNDKVSKDLLAEAKIKVLKFDKESK